MAEVGIKKFLLSMNQSELLSWCEKKEISSIGKAQFIADRILREYSGRSETFYSEYVEFSLKRINKECKNDNIDFALVQRILSLLLEKKQRKEEIILKILDFDNSIISALNLLYMRKLILRKHKRNYNYYLLSIPNELRSHISSKLSDHNEIKSRHILGFIDSIIKETGYPIILITSIFNAFMIYDSYNKEDLAFTCLKINNLLSEYKLEDSKALIGFLIEKQIVIIKKDKYYLATDFKNNISNIIQYLDNPVINDKLGLKINFIMPELAKINNLPQPVKLFIIEAIKAYNHEMPLSCSFCLGCASEILINYLSHSISSYLGSISVTKRLKETTIISKKMEFIKQYYKDGISRNMNHLVEQLKNKNITLSQKEIVLLKSDFINLIEPLFQTYRFARNETGHPRIDFDQKDLPPLTVLHANLISFVTYAKTIVEVCNILNNTLNDSITSESNLT